MLKHALLGSVLAALTADLAFAQARTLPGRQLDIIADPIGTRFVPSIGADATLSPIRGIFWDERCASVEYTFNTNQGANEGTADRIGPNVLANIVQRGLNRWNNIRTAYIEMNVVNRTDLGNRPRIGGDFINEVTFVTDPGFTALASSPSTSLLADTDFIAGEDLDGDGDSDVYDPSVEGQNVCTDIDGDGDFEFPAGFYRAGTILDNDVQFGADVFWETTPTDLGGAADVDAVSTHEFGHSHGLNHSFINQISINNGTSSTMFPFIDTGDPVSEAANRSLHIDDIAATSQLYPEGQGTTPISQLQGNDQAFTDRFAIISGSVTDGTGFPIVGAAVTAIRESDGSVGSLTYSGQTGLFDGFSIFDESFNNGDFELAVPVNNTYNIAIEALDGNPAAAGNISTNAIIADIIGQTSFPTERWDARESNFEITPAAAESIVVGITDVSGVDLVVNEEIIQSNAPGTGLALSGVAIGATSVRYIEHFDRQDVIDRLAAGDVPFAGEVLTFILGPDSNTFEFSRGALALGDFLPDGTPRIRQLLGTVDNVLGEDFEEITVPFTNPANLRNLIDDRFDQSPAAELFFILDIDNIGIDPNTGLPIGFVVEDNTVTGTSYASVNNGPAQLIPNAWVMSLKYVNDGRPVPPRFSD